MARNRQQTWEAPACNGNGAKYFALNHYIRGMSIDLVKFELGDAAQVERNLDLPRVQNPYRILGLAENGPAEQRKLLRYATLPATSTVIRECEKHQRSEIAARLIWAAFDGDVIDIDTRSVKLNAQRVGVATAQDPLIGKLPRIVSVPLTAAERSNSAYRTERAVEVVRVAEHQLSTFALIHGPQDRPPLEDIHFIPVLSATNG